MGQRAKTWLAAVALAVLSACATVPMSEPPPRTLAWPSSGEPWQLVPDDRQLTVTRRDGKPIYRLQAYVFKNLLIVERDLGRASGVRAQTFLTEDDGVAVAMAMARYHDGKPVILIQIRGLSELARDRDALAVMIGHELAHFHLGHLRLAMLPVRLLPFGMAEAFSRQEEIAADEQGIRWAIAAGYSACGLVRLPLEQHVASFNPFQPAGIEERSSTLRDLVDDREDRHGWQWWVAVAIAFLIAVAGADQVVECVHVKAFPACF